MVAPDRKEIASGLRAGDKVVIDALDLQNAADKRRCGFDRRRPDWFA
jgi:hypothetical protein